MSGFRGDFHSAAETLGGLVSDGEFAHLWFAAERSEFARLNDARVRQAGLVEQRRAQVELIAGQRHARASLDLGGDSHDDASLAATLAALRVQIAACAPDPHLLFGDDAGSLDDERRAELPGAAQVLAEVTAPACGGDLVGIWAAGESARGFASTRGARRWHSRDSFNFDWSVHAGADRAVKNRLAGDRWDPQLLRQRLADDRERLGWLRETERTLPPGRYRAYLAPAAMAELMALLSWGGFGLRGIRTGQSALARLARGECRLADAVCLTEDLSRGLAPAFTRDGFALPDEVTLVRAGRFESALVSPRSAHEYDAAVNSADETPVALDMAAGQLDGRDPPALVGDGIEVANLWYCNHVDRNDCRVTGMTRFACFVIENGRRVAPLAAMRFDDTLYDLLGERLLGLTQQREFLASPDTYEQRSLALMCLPGVLVEGLRLVE